jgi:hypothetical protein
LKANIILVAKYTFTPESPNEIFVKKGDILKLLDRPGNGWLLVKFIDKVTKPGLVPASYVGIAVNDPQNPITLSWLHNNTIDLIDESNYLDLYCKSAPLTINNKPYPTLAKIENFLLYENRYWYQVDIDFSDGSKGYTARYYQDFYNLHLKLLANHTGEDSLKLPKLPEPIPTSSKKSYDKAAIEGKGVETEDIELLLQRCHDLNTYINALISHKNYRLSPTLIEWLDINYNDLPGFFLSETLTSDEINLKLLPGSINVLQRKKEADLEQEKSEKARDSNESFQCVPVEDLPKRTKSKNIFNHYHQAQVYNERGTQSVLRKPSNGDSGSRQLPTQSPRVHGTTTFTASTKYPTPQLPSSQGNGNANINDNSSKPMNPYQVANKKYNNLANSLSRNPSAGRRYEDMTPSFSPNSGPMYNRIGPKALSFCQTPPLEQLNGHSNHSPITVVANVPQITTNFKQPSPPPPPPPGGEETSFDSVSSNESPITPKASSKITSMGTPRLGKPGKPYVPRIQHPSEFLKNSPR